MAITITREKNIISVLIVGKKAPYTFDINTGIVYGIRGKAVKTMPKEAFNGLAPEWGRQTELQEVIYSSCWGCTDLERLQSWASAIRLADSFDNLGIKVNMGYGTAETYNELAQNKKLCRAYIKFAQERVADKVSYSYREFLTEEKRKRAKATFDFNIDDRQYDRIRGTLYDLCEWATPRQIKCFCTNFVDNGFYLIGEWSVSNIYGEHFRKYCQYCEYINEKVTNKDNFISEYARVYKAYMAQKEEIDKKKFKEAMDIHRAEMEFEYGDFKVVVPTTPQDIKDEGRNMHHCVARYAYNCMDTTNKNRSHIVFVRRKETPDKCYITCEIKNGNICQYYLSHDRRITSAEDIEFCERYQAHLRNSWKKE